MKKRMVLVMILVMAMVLAACGTEAPDSNGEDSSGAVDVDHKVLRVGSVYANKTFDPWAPTDAFDNSGRANIYDTLIYKDGDGKVVSSLASWEWAEDMLSVTFKLVDGVTFHNGDPLTAEDVKFSIDQAREAAVSKAYLSAIEDVEIVDEGTIKLNLNTKNVAILEVLIAYGQIVNKDVYVAAGEQAGDNIESVIGTGPYKLTAWVPSESATYEANETYFKGVPTIKTIEVKAITDYTAALIALQTSDIDVYTASLPALSVGELASYDNVNVVDVPAQRLYYLGMNWEKGPFANNPKLREAVAHAVDRDALNLIANESLGEIVYYPGKSSYSGYPEVADAGYKYDVEKAKALVQEAGAEGLSFAISLENDGCLPQMATALQNMFAAVGLECTVNSMDVNAYMSDVYANGNYDMFISFTTARTRDIDTVWTQLFSTANIGQGNSGRFSDARMDEILLEGRSEKDEATRKTIYAEGVKIFQEDIPYLALFYEFGNRVLASDLQVVDGMTEYDCFYYYSWK